VLLIPILLLQACWVKFKLLKLPEAAGNRAGCSGDGSAINVLILGDSAAAGVGVNEQKCALTGQLAANLAVNHKISWQLIASSGFTSNELIKEIQALPAQTFNYVLVSVGVNDVSHLTLSKDWLNNLHVILDLLNTKFAEPKVLLTGIPPMHLFTGIPQPLRWCLGKRAQRLNQLMVKVAADKSQCSVLTVNFPITSEYLAEDGVHPSKLAYHVWAKQAAEVLIP